MHLPQLPLHVDPHANLPMFAQLRQQIVWLIASGVIKPGERLPTIRKLADQLDVHMHTIRQTYHSLQHDGFVEVNRSRGTIVLPLDIHNLSTQNETMPSHTIGVLLPNMNPFYDPFLDGLEASARRASYLLMVSFTRDDPALTTQLIQQMLARNVDGIIIASPVDDLLKTKYPANLPPLVYVDAPQFESNVVLLDLENSGFAATSHLIYHGHRQIGIITAPLTWQNFYESFKGYKRALETASLELDPGLVIETPAFLLESGYQSAAQLLDHPHPPTAIFVSGDLLAAGAIRAIKDRNLSVPGDIAVASKDNIALAALIDPPLTTVASPTFQMGVEALNMVTAKIFGKNLEKKRVILGTRLVIRRSCGCRD